MDVSGSNRKRDCTSATDESTAQPPTKNVKREEDDSTSPQQNDVIDVSDDEAERQAVVTSVKIETGELEREQPDRPAEVQLRHELIMVKRNSLDLELKLLNMEQQLAMKDSMLQRERRATREAELRADRAERAEKLLKSQEVFDEPKKSELEKSVSDLTMQLEDARAEIQRANEKITDLTNQLEKERGLPDERIDELKRKLATYESSKQVQIVLDRIARRRIIPRFDSTADKKSIIRLLKPEAEHSMPIDEAIEMVRSAFEKCGEDAKNICKYTIRFDVCDVCGIELLNKLVVTTHFLSEEHIEKVRPHNARVSKRAVNAWVKMLVDTEEAAKGRK